MSIIYEFLWGGYRKEPNVTIVCLMSDSYVYRGKLGIIEDQKDLLLNDGNFR